MPILESIVKIMVECDICNSIKEETGNRKSECIFNLRRSGWIVKRNGDKTLCARCRESPGRIQGDH